MNSLMKIKDKNREKNIEFYKRRWEENNRKPPLGLYNPRYNYIDKHIPGFNFYNDPSHSKKFKKKRTQILKIVQGMSQQLLLP